MNNIFYAGEIGKCDGERHNKCAEIIVPQTEQGGIIKFSGGERTFSRNEIVVVPPLCRHELSCAESHLHVLIERALLPLNDVFITADVENFGICHAARQAAEFFKSDYKKKNGVLNALGNLLVSYVLLRLGEREEYSPVVATVLADIEKNVSDSSYSLENAIKRLPLNYDYVRKLFKKEVGATPLGYLTGKRMELAHTLITSGVTNQYSGFTVSQIAEACGFSEPLYFSRVFKKHFGVAPSEYCKE